MDNDRRRHVAAEQLAAPSGPVLQFWTLHGRCGTRHVRQVEACTKAFPGDMRGPDLWPQQGTKLPAKRSSFSRTHPGPRRHKAVPAWGLGGKQESHAQCS